MADRSDETRRQRRIGATPACLAVVASAAILVAGLTAGSPAGAGTAHSWTVISSPNKAAPGASELMGVSCVSTRMCKAVGWSGGFFSYVLVESWNGKTWSLSKTPSMLPRSSSLQGVSCVTPSFCKAVGSWVKGHTATSPLAETWNGKRWSVDAKAKHGGFGFLESVSCTSTKACVAVGSTLSKTLVERWNGSAWTVVASPNVSAASGTNTLLSVSCASSTACSAVGFTYLSNSDDDVTLALIWRGKSWSVVPSPSPGGVSDHLDGVSCRGTTCEGVGSTQQGADTIPLTVTWNGKKWSTVPSWWILSQNPVLVALSCTAKSSCQSVGHDLGSIYDQTLAQAFNGSSWTFVSSANNGASANELASVSCSSASACVAVGTYFDGTTQRTLVEVLK